MDNAKTNFARLCKECGRPVTRRSFKFPDGSVAHKSCPPKGAR